MVLFSSPVGGQQHQQQRVLLPQQQQQQCLQQQRLHLRGRARFRPFVGPANGQAGSRARSLRTGVARPNTVVGATTVEEEEARRGAQGFLVPGIKQGPPQAGQLSSVLSSLPSKTQLVMACSLGFCLANMGECRRERVLLLAVTQVGNQLVFFSRACSAPPSRCFVTPPSSSLVAADKVNFTLAVIPMGLENEWTPTMVGLVQVRAHRTCSPAEAGRSCS
eukprot:731444-Pelagomonas_calceolata.AAC.1